MLKGARSLRVLLECRLAVRIRDQGQPVQGRQGGRRPHLVGRQRVSHFFNSNQLLTIGCFYILSFLNVGKKPWPALGLFILSFYSCHCILFIKYKGPSKNDAPFGSRNKPDPFFSTRFQLCWDSFWLIPLILHYCRTYLDLQFLTYVISEQPLNVYLNLSSSKWVIIPLHPSLLGQDPLLTPKVK